MVRAIITERYIRRFSYHTVGSICRFHTMGAKPHVGVVGSGISGLRCADILIQNGARVTILEARDRIGGRVCLYSPAAWIFL
jgi:NADPH-dependent glutamate synthase beta subunit-like oxidoreductase